VDKAHSQLVESRCPKPRVILTLDDTNRVSIGKGTDIPFKIDRREHDLWVV